MGVEFGTVVCVVVVEKEFVVFVRVTAIFYRGENQDLFLRSQNGKQMSKYPSLSRTHTDHCVMVITIARFTNEARPSFLWLCRAISYKYCTFDAHTRRIQ